MTHPRQILPGTTYMVTRRCSEQRFFLTPSAQVNTIFAYCLGYAAKTFNIELHAFCVMSNHWHAVITDTQGHLPLFMAWVHKYVAKCVNQHLKRRENLWSAEPYSAQVLAEPQAVMDKMVYCLGNPVKAHLVQHAHQWPGLSSVHFGFEDSDLSEYQRPQGFFREAPKGNMPNSVSIPMSVPKAFQNTPTCSFQQAVNTALAEYEKQCAQQRRGKVWGLKRIQKLSLTDTPKSLQQRFARHLSVTGKTAQVLGRALEALKLFRQAYRDAFERYRLGKHNTVFPAGTYKLRLEASVCCGHV